MIMFKDYQVTIKHSKRKTASIYIERDGAVTVMVPEHLDSAHVNRILHDNEYKIHKYQAKRKLLNESAVTREPVNGQSFLYLGRNYYLQYHDEADVVGIKGRHFNVPNKLGSKIQAAFRRFYKRKGKEIVAPRVDKYAKMMGLEIKEITIMDLKTRWASCSLKKPKVNFHWKIMMAPLSVIEYLIVHELVHFKHKRHNAEFWNEVDKILPDYQNQVQWLKDYGASLSI